MGPMVQVKAWAVSAHSLDETGGFVDERGALSGCATERELPFSARPSGAAGLQPRFHPEGREGAAGQNEFPAEVGESPPGQKEITAESGESPPGQNEFPAGCRESPPGQNEIMAESGESPRGWNGFPAGCGESGLSQQGIAAETGESPRVQNEFRSGWPDLPLVWNESVFHNGPALFPAQGPENQGLEPSPRVAAAMVESGLGAG